MKTTQENNFKEHFPGSKNLSARALSGKALLAALAIGLLPAASHAQLTPASATGIGPKATDTSTLFPNTVNAGNDTPNFFTGQCAWITTAMNAFVAASGGAYTYTWAVPTFNLQADLSVNQYSAWVNTSPNKAGGFPLTGGIANADAGGADFGLTYTPTAAGSPQNILFIQAFQEIFYAAPGLANPTTNVKLDNTGATPQYGGASSYGAGGAASKLGDEPYDSLGANAVGYHTDVEFQDAVAVDNVVGGVNNLTLYQGEEWWGYQFSTSAVPEPSISAFAGLTSLLLLGARSVRRRSRAIPPASLTGRSNFRS